MVSEKSTGVTVFLSCPAMGIRVEDCQEVMIQEKAAQRGSLSCRIMLHNDIMLGLSSHLALYSPNLYLCSRRLSQDLAQENQNEFSDQISYSYGARKALTYPHVVLSPAQTRSSDSIILASLLPYSFQKVSSLCFISYVRSCILGKSIRSSEELRVPTYSNVRPTAKASVRDPSSGQAWLDLLFTRISYQGEIGASGLPARALLKNVQKAGDEQAQNNLRWPLALRRMCLVEMADSGALRGSNRAALRARLSKMKSSSAYLQQRSFPLRI